jgi:epoxyqueuosine reductase
MPTSISDVLRREARQLGFSAIRITAAHLDPQHGERLRQFVALGYHGDMAWLADTLARRQSPEAMWPAARSAILLAMSYAPSCDVPARLRQSTAGNISVYALHRDYHDVMKGKLKHLAQWLARASRAEAKVFVDTAPLMEKPLAHQAGLGWQGKHSNLVSRELGSWFFIGTILTAAPLASDAPEIDHCGSCRACLDACPTGAFPAPYQIDARRCISYLTIEYQGHIAPYFRPLMGNRIYGCDDCLAACPWNKFAQAANELKLRARSDLLAPDLARLAALDNAGFRQMFAGSPVKRIGRDRFVRNVMIAIGNSGAAALAPYAAAALADASPLVRAMAAWAARQLLPGDAFAALRQRHVASEADGAVLAEWMAA